MANRIFNTSRPRSIEERVHALAEQKNTRLGNRKSLMEATEAAEDKKEKDAELAKIDEDHEKSVDKEQRLEKLQEATFAASRKRDMMSLESRLFQEGKTVLWNKILFETAYNANWVDSSVKQQIIRPMYELYESTMGFLQNTIPGAFTKNPTRLLEALNDVVVETAKNAAKRITEEAEHDVGSDPTRIQFDLNQDEEDEFDNAISDLSADDIASKVKEKVLSVVQDEKKAAKTKADTMKEIDDAKKDDDSSEEEDDDETKSDDDKDSDDSDEKDDDESKGDKKKKSDDSDDDDKDEPEDDESSKKTKSEDDKDSGTDDDDDKSGDGKKKKSDDSDDDTEDVTEGILTPYVPEEYYKEVVSFFTAILKKSNGNNAHDATLHITKAGRVDITNFKAVKATGKKKFSRVLDLAPDDAVKIAKSCGFKRGTGKILAAGVFMLKPIKGGGYAELQISDGYKAEYSSVGTETGGVYGSSSYAAYSGSSVNMKYLKQALITITFIPTVNNSLRERYMIESGIVYGKPDWKVALEQRVLEKKVRELNTSTGNSIFESMLMAARVSVEKDAVLENVQMAPNQIGDAMMIEAITRYTVLETLNTMGIVSLTNADGVALKKAYMEELSSQGNKIMSVDNAPGTKTTRINTQKYKKNNDTKVMSAPKA